ncbi:MAG: helix-turn-helix domain-containing protein [Chloroflexi bacterium]|nr:helix-turn-helix domain-containing protein [Chloroflexota bacterium]
MPWQHKEWLTLSEVAQMLGVHPSTVRIWANEGKIPVHRTRGGHRRFRRSELELWMLAQNYSNEVSIPKDFIQTALQQVRMRVDEGALAREPWYQKLDEEAREQYRRSGRALLQGLWAYLINSSDRAKAEAEAQALGYEYATRARQAGLTKVEALQAFLFFCNATIEAFLDVIDRSQVQSSQLWIAVLRKVKDFSSQVARSLMETFEAYEQHYPTTS